MAAVPKTAEVAEILGASVAKALVGPGVFKGRMPIP
jgi:hypothetical protein